MDALEVLRAMHVEAKAAFEQIKETAPAERGGLWQKLKPELEVHEQIEERFVYDPVADDASGRDEVLAQWEEEHEQQVAEADAMIARIDGGNPASAEWLRDVTSLAATLETHIAHEEGVIWQRIRSVWNPERLERAGRSVATAKDAVKAGTPVADAVAQAEQMHD